MAVLLSRSGHGAFFCVMKRAGIALGSNLGDKNSLMVQARDHLLQMSLSDDPFLQSSLYATSPQDCPHGADDYLNAVVEFTWPGTVEELLVHCQGIERALGRVRSGIRCEPRTADVDIIYVGDMVVNDSPRLILPHPRAHLRKFVLKPLSDIRPDLILPRQDKTVAELLAELDTDEADPLLVSERW